MRIRLSTKVRQRDSLIPRRSAVLSLAVAALGSCFGVPAWLHAQEGVGGLTAPPTAREIAPIDLTGYWVSVVSEDWRWRMVTPPVGSYPSVPLNAEGRRIADAWDPARDEAAGEECKAYGAANIMRLPTRLHVTWEDDNTLRIDTDAGMQTRLLHFGGSQPEGGERTWQGYSMAEWQFAGSAARAFVGAPRRESEGGRLKVVTNRMRAGYLQKNGVPYSDSALLTEYFLTTTGPQGDTWLILTALVDDPQYLAAAPPGVPGGDRYGPFIRSTNFKKLPDASGWNPMPCSAR